MTYHARAVVCRQDVRVNGHDRVAGMQWNSDRMSVSVSGVWGATSLYVTWLSSHRQYAPTLFSYKHHQAEKLAVESFVTGPKWLSTSVFEYIAVCICSVDWLVALLWIHAQQYYLLSSHLTLNYLAANCDYCGRFFLVRIQSLRNALSFMTLSCLRDHNLDLPIIETGRNTNAYSISLTDQKIAGGNKGVFHTTVWYGPLVRKTHSSVT